MKNGGFDGKGFQVSVQVRRMENLMADGFQVSVQVRRMENLMTEVFR